MKSILFLCVTCLCFNFSVFSQSISSYNEAATLCLKSNGTLAYYETVFDACFKQMQNQYAGLKIPSETWNELKAVKPEAMKSVNEKLVLAYQDYFNIEDVHSMNKLYTSKAGQTMINNPSGLTKKDKKTIDDFYKSATGKKIVKSQAEMKEDLQVISDFWCGEMYRAVNEKLENKGYSIR